MELEILVVLYAVGGLYYRSLSRPCKAAPINSQITFTSSKIARVPTTARDATDENVTKFKTWVAWYNVSASCFFWMIAGITREIVNIAEDHAYGTLDKNELGSIKAMEDVSYLHSENLPGITQPIELTGG